MTSPPPAVATVDVLMVTHDRPDYTRRSLPRLLDACDDSARVWLWHNGPDGSTRDVVAGVAHHPRLHRVHLSPTNVGLRLPCNWLWRQSDARLVGKVDDDCLVDDGWLDILRSAHRDNDHFGVVGSWRFPDEDVVPRLVRRKLRRFAGGHRLLCNPWVQGSGYLMKRRCIEHLGPLGSDETFTDYCIRLAIAGWTNGWYYPFVHEEHMDDPRSPFTALHTDEDLRARRPLSARMRGVDHLAAWQDQIRLDAHEVQACSADPRHHVGIRRRLRSLRRRARSWWSQHQPTTTW